MSKEPYITVRPEGTISIISENSTGIHMNPQPYYFRAIHNPKDGNCRKNLPGERSYWNERCAICRPHVPETYVINEMEP